jgi:hypothetical protein
MRLFVAAMGKTENCKLLGMTFFELYMKHLLSLLLVLLLIPTPAAFSQCGVLYDGLDTIARNQYEVRDVTEVNRTPLFDNAPFLHLRKGDKIVKARRDFSNYRSKPVSDPDRINYYLLSGGKYYLIWTEEEKGKLLLSQAFYGGNNCLLFDWELTMENAKALRELLPDHYTQSLTLWQYDAIVASARKEFPEIEFRPPGQLFLCEGRLVSIPGHRLAEFQGLTYDRSENCFYNYWLRIGPEIFTITREVVAQGPKPVDRSEFEGHDSANVAVINGSPNLPWKPDARTAKIKRAEYDKMVKFQNLVIAAINSIASSQPESAAQTPKELK